MIKTTELISTFPLLTVFFICTKTHTHSLLPHLEKPPWSFVATATPKSHIHLHPGLKPLRHQTQQSTKGQMAEGHTCLKMGSFLGSGAFFSTEWLEFLTVSRSYWPDRLVKLKLFHVEVYTQHLLYWMWHTATPNCSLESKSFSCPSDSPHLCITSGAHSSACII